MRSAKPANHIHSTGKKNRINVFSNSSGRKIYRMYESLINVDILITFSLQMNEDKLHKKRTRRRFITSPLWVLVAHLLLQETGDESWKKKILWSNQPIRPQEIALKNAYWYRTRRCLLTIERFQSRGQNLCKFMEIKEIFTCEKSSTVTGFVRNTYMVEVILFGTSIWQPWGHVKTLYNIV